VVAEVEGEDVGGGGDAQGAAVEAGHLRVADEGNGPMPLADAEEGQEAAEGRGELGVGGVEDLEVDGHGT